MKRKKICIMIALVLCIALSCCACGGGRSSEKIEESISGSSEIAQETEDAIKKAFIEHYSDEHIKILPEDIIIKGYYGTYNGAEVVMVNCVKFMYAATGINWFTVDGVKLIMGGSENLYVFKNEAMYSINDAYKQRILTYDNVLEIQKGLYEMYRSYYDMQGIQI